jgi:predicted negative regulator of RcsB-dependent stress response
VTSLEVEDVKRRVDALERAYDWVILPMTLLVGILALGGAIGVVFSIRDQRRVSQLHELTVSAEMAGQLRAEQSFTAFLEGSQKTLNLVNDTLQLAKEATESESRRTEQKASAALDGIEEDAEELVLAIDEGGDFEELVDVPGNRTELRRIAADLAALEGYVRLQDVDLKPYSRFVKGIDRYLLNDTTGALHAIRHATQDESKRQLQRMARYWVAKLNIAVGNYTNASHMLETAKGEAAPGTVQWLEYERLRLETEFFEAAAGMPVDATPRERLAEVRSLLAQLASAASAMDVATEHDEDKHPRHEMAAARANIYMWIAYDRRALHRPLKKKAVAASASPGDELPAESGIERQRAWAVSRASAIYPARNELHLEQGVDFGLRFGRTECDFLLGHSTGDEYTLLESHAIEEQHEAHREHAHAIELAQIDLICSARLLHQAGRNDPHARAAVMNAYRRIRQTLGTAPDHAVRVFSHLSRRNVPQGVFADEAVALKQLVLGEDNREQEVNAD